MADPPASTVTATPSLLPSPTTDVNDMHANLSSTNTDPFKFSHGLTGVDQPSNYRFANLLLCTVVVVASLTIIFRLCTTVLAAVRQASIVACPGRQAYWTRNRFQAWARFKASFLCAPLGTTRHNREIQLSSAVSIGTLPSRIQFLLLFVYSTCNLLYCLAIPWGEVPAHQAVAELRGRCGALAVFNLLFTVLFALRNNPLIWLLHVNYDTFNLFHRWLGRIVFAEALGHVSAWMHNTYQVDGFHGLDWVLGQAVSYQWGLAGFVAFCILVIHSVGPLRHAFYETFLNLHRLCIIIALLGVYVHMVKHALPQLPWGQLAIALLAIEHACRFARIIYSNASRKAWSRVTVEALPAEATRVTFQLARPWTQGPGSHVHIYIPQIALWSSHPFSVAWTTAREPSFPEKMLPVADDLDFEPQGGTLSCIIRARTGMTQELYRRASEAKNGTLQTWGAVEGPYGGYQSLDSYGTVVLFAAGVGITHQISYLRHLLDGHNKGIVAAQKVVLAWSVRSTAMVEWVRPWLNEIVAMPNFARVIDVQLFVSRVDNSSSSALPRGLTTHLGRCNPKDVVDAVVHKQIGSMVVTVCGPGAFSDDVRRAARRRMTLRSIDFIEEAFTY